LPRPAWVLFGVAAVALLGFLWLGRAVATGQTTPFDTAVRETVHAWGSVWLTRLMVGITQFGTPRFLIIVTIVVGWRLSRIGRWRAAALLALSTIGMTALSESLKVIYHRPRPSAFFGYTEPMSYSYPSGHADTSICFYGMLVFIVSGHIKSDRRRLAVWVETAILILLIGCSRVYLGVHYPTDVIGGYCLGLAWLIGIASRFVHYYR
jgi:undecaprenyl-diphosphatase